MQATRAGDTLPEWKGIAGSLRIHPYNRLYETQSDPPRGDFYAAFC
jgi:hypothetical protein